MRQRTLGILGGSLLIGGIILGVATGIAGARVAPNEGTAIHRPLNGGLIPGQRRQRAPGPFFGDPNRRNFPAPGGPQPNAPGSTPST